MDSFIALPAKRYTAGPCLQNHLGKIVTSSILIIQRGYDQLVDILLISS